MLLCIFHLRMHLSAKEYGQDIVFLHHVEAGPANKSYGIAVAKLAGMPSRALNTAHRHLRILEEAAVQNIKQDDLFAEPLTEENNDHENLSALRELINNTDPDILTPREALDIIYHIKKLL